MGATQKVKAQITLKFFFNNNINKLSQPTIMTLGGRESLINCLVGHLLFEFLINADTCMMLNQRLRTNSEQLI